MIKKGIDISFWQEGADFHTIATQNDIDFIIFREGKGQEIDKCFLHYVKEAKKNNLNIKGVYHFCYSLSIADVIQQAKSCMKNIQLAGLNKKDIYVFFDFQYDTVNKAKAKGVKLTKKDCINFTKTFCEQLTKNGYKAGIYANKDYYLNMYQPELINKYAFWLAEPNKSVPSYQCDIFQYSFTGKIKGINGNVDLNLYYEKEGNKKMSNIDFTKYYNKISNSGKDENKKLHGGKAGDQNKHEWEIIDWYSRPWTCVLRYPNQEIREMFAELGIEAALNNLIGYDQYQRDTYWIQLKASDFRPSKIKVACEADCSKGVISNVKAVGYLKNIDALKNIKATYTGNMRSAFQKAGFIVLTASKYLKNSNYLLPGDILLYDNHHTATNLGIGKYTTEYKNIQQKQKQQTETDNSKLNKEPKQVGIVKANSLYVRTWAGTENPTLKSIPVIAKNTEIEICDTLKDKNNNLWYYIRINKKTYGFVSAKWIETKTK